MKSRGIFPEQGPENIDIDLVGFSNETVIAANYYTVCLYVVSGSTGSTVFKLKQYRASRPLHRRLFLLYLYDCIRKAHRKAARGARTGCGALQVFVCVASPRSSTSRAE